jgi:DNA-binding CsgD family transcriptional regulator
MGEHEFSVRLLERDQEIGRVARLLGRAREGAGLPVLIDGPPGIGKTRLMQAVVERALLDGFEVRTARATELERDFPFGLVRQLFEPVLAALGEDAKADLMGGAASMAMPVFAPPVSPVPPPDPDYGHLHGLYWLAANLAERHPLVLAIDDAHWADQASLRFLSFLSPRLDGLPLMLVVSTRGAEPGAGPGLGAEITEHPDLELIRPRPLSEAAVGRVLREAFGDPAAERLAAACRRATGGNPFLLTELVLDLGGRPDLDSLSAEDIDAVGPDRIARSVLRRLDRAGPDARGLAESLAVLGDRAGLDQAAALSGVSLADARRLAEKLVAAAIFERGPPLRFAHPILRTAVYSQVGHAARVDAHGRAAELLAEAGASEAAAMHLLSTEPRGDQWVVECLRSTAGTTLGRGEPGLAIRYLERALAEPPEGDAKSEVLFELARASGQAGEQDAIERLRAAERLAHNPRLRTLASTELAMALHFLDRGEEAIDVAESALQDLSADDVELAPQLRAILLIGAHHTPATRKRTLGEIRAAVRRAEAGDTDPVTLAHAAFERCVADGSAVEAADFAERAFEAGLIAAVTADFPSVYPCALALSLGDRFDAAERRLSEAVEEARGRGSARGFAPAAAVRGWNRYRRGALAGAEGDARASAELMTSEHIVRPVALAVLICTLIDRGRLHDATHVAESFDPGTLRVGLFSLPFYYEAVALLRLRQGRPREALSALEPIAAWETESGYRAESWVARRSLEALARSDLGEQEPAQALALEAVSLTSRLGSARAHGVALRVQALVGGAEQREPTMRAAVDVLERSGARLEHARALIDLGAAIRRANRSREARAALQDGLELADRCGAGGLVDRAVAELVAAGARPRRTVQSGAAALTPAERRVADLAAEGRTNREIAQALFVTQKTVETHLGSVYRKLEISSRVQLSGKLAD